MAVITSVAQGPGGSFARFTYFDTATGEQLGKSYGSEGSSVGNCVVAGRSVIAGGYDGHPASALHAGQLPRPSEVFGRWGTFDNSDRVGGVDVSPDGRHLLITRGLEPGGANGPSEQGVMSVAVDGTPVSEVTVSLGFADLVGKFTEDGTGAVVGDPYMVRKVTVDPVTGALGVPDQQGTSVPGNGGLSSLEVDGDLTFVVTNRESGNGELIVLRTADLAVLSTTSLSKGGTSVVVSPGGQTAYVLTRDNAVVAYDVDRTNGTVGLAWWKDIAGTDSHRVYAESTLAITPDGANLYARNGDGAGVSVVDTATQAVTTLDVVGRVTSVCMSETLDNRVPFGSITGEHTGDDAAEPGTDRPIELFVLDYDSDPLDFAWTVDDDACSFVDATVEDPELTCPHETYTTMRVAVFDGYDTVEFNNPVEFAERDATAPVIDVTLDGTAGANGWYVSPVKATWQITDLESPVAATSGCEEASVTEPGATLNCTATSDGGTATGTVPVHVDLTDPRVTCPSAPTFPWGASEASVIATVADDVSGPATTTTTAAADTSVSGFRTVMLTGADLAGRTTTVTCGYVVASRYDFIGFSSPLDDTMNRAKAGQAIPLKWQLLDRSDGTPAVHVTAVSMAVTSLTCEGVVTADAIEEYSVGASGLQNLGEGFYQLNWKSPTSYAGSCKTLHLTFDDGSQQTAQFWFKG